MKIQLEICDPAKFLEHYPVESYLQFALVITYLFWNLLVAFARKWAD